MYAPLIWIHIYVHYTKTYIYINQLIDFFDVTPSCFAWCSMTGSSRKNTEWSSMSQVMFEVLEEQQVKQLTGTLTSWSPHSNDGRQINHQMSQHFRRRKRNEGRGQGWRKGFQVEQASFTRKMTVTQGVEGGEDLHCVRMHFWIGGRQDGHFLSQN